MSLWGAWEQPRTLGHIPLLFSSLEWASSFFLFFFTCHSCQAQWRWWWWWRWVAAAPIPFFSSPKLHPTVPSGAEEDNAQTVTSTLLSGKKVGLSSEHPPLIHRHGVTAPRRADCVCVCACVYEGWLVPHRERAGIRSLRCVSTPWRRPDYAGFVCVYIYIL